MPRIDGVDPAKATGEAKELLDAVQRKLGLTPNIMRTLANEPAALKGYLAFGDALASGRFDAKTREAIALTVAGANNCEYCASAHAAISSSLKVDRDEIGLRLKGRSKDPKIAAALLFASKIVETQGIVSDDDIANVRAAGHDNAAIVEIIAHVTANIFTNYINHVAQTEIDFPRVNLDAARAA